MSIAKFFPEFRALTQFEEPFSLRDPFFSGSLTRRHLPAMDLQETKDAYVVKADVPGYTKDKIEIHADGSTLIIKGHAEETKEEKDVHHHTKERYQSSFQRSVTLPMEIPADKIQASLENGVLSLNIPKVNPKQQKIEIQ